MKYTGFRLVKIEAERFNNKLEKSNINVNSNFDLGTIKKEDVQDSKRNVFSFEFTYSLDYEDTAKLLFKGQVFVEFDDKSKIKELEKNGVNAMDEDLRKFILDIVLAKTHVESLRLEEQLGIPFHIQSPRVNFEKK